MDLTPKWCILNGSAFDSRLSNQKTNSKKVRDGMGILHKSGSKKDDEGRRKVTGLGKEKKKFSMGRDHSTNKGCRGSQFIAGVKVSS